MVAEKCICCEPFREKRLPWRSLTSACETEQGKGRKSKAACPGEDFPSMAQLRLLSCARVLLGPERRAGQWVLAPLRSWAGGLASKSRGWARRCLGL